MPKTIRKNTGPLEPRSDIATESGQRLGVRIAITELYVSLLLLARRRMPLSSFSDILIVYVVAQGAFQGSPLSALKVSNITGLSPQTVGRRLERLMKDGYVARKGRGLRQVYVCKWLPPIDTELTRKMVAVLEPVLQTLRVHNGHLGSERGGSPNAAGRDERNRGHREEGPRNKGH